MWIYQHLLADKRAGGLLYRHLRSQKKRRKRYGKNSKRGPIHGRRRLPLGLRIWRKGGKLKLKLAEEMLRETRRRGVTPLDVLFDA